MVDKYVVAGVWQDDEWRKAAVGRNTQDSAQEMNQLLYAQGPRSHPYGIHAFTVLVDGEPRIYPSREAAEEDGASPGPEQPGIVEDAPSSNGSQTTSDVPAPAHE